MRLQLQQWSSFTSAAALDRVSIDKKQQHPQALIFRPSFFCGTTCRTLVQRNSVLLIFDNEFKKATLKHTWLFGMLKPSLPWCEIAGAFGIVSLALLFLWEKLWNPCSKPLVPLILWWGIPIPEFFYQYSFVFSPKNSLNQYVFQYFSKHLIVLRLAQTFNLKILKCTIKRRSTYWGSKYINEPHSCQHLL